MGKRPILHKNIKLRMPICMTCSLIFRIFFKYKGIYSYLDSTVPKSEFRKLRFYSDHLIHLHLLLCQRMAQQGSNKYQMDKYDRRMLWPNEDNEIERHQFVDTSLWTKAYFDDYTDIWWKQMFKEKCQDSTS